VVGGIVYGSYSAPEQPGSGGASRNIAWVPGDGGGAVRISVGGHATINGDILANGVYNGIYSGGGSGGSVYIDCETFAGNGMVSVNGNSVSNGGGGGAGGRIAVVYNVLAQSNQSPFSVTFTAKGGTGALHQILTRDGELGTIYFPDTPLLTETISLAHVGRLIIPGANTWALNSLTVSAACDLVLPDGFTVTVANECQIGYGALDLGWGGSLHVGGTVTLTDGGALKIRSAATNGVITYGARLAVTNDIAIASGAWLYLYCNPTNGGVPLVTCRNVNISSSDAGINADYGGFKGGASTVSQDGYGPGYGFGGKYGGAAGYGGQGSLGQFGVGWSPMYGCDTNVTLPGSGGGSFGSGNGGDGGGLVRLVATGDVVVNGAISANGFSGWYYSGGGSGGGIDVTCHTLTGTGSIRANGGKLGVNTAGGGGGGRIAIHYNEAAQILATPQNILFSVAGGLGAYGYSGEKGTVFFPPMLREQIDLAHVGKLVMPGQSDWAPASITVGAACDLELPVNFLVDVAGDVVVNTGQYGFGEGSEITVGGNVVLTNGGCMVVRSGPTNDVNNDYGALLNVSGDLVIRANSWLYPYCSKTNGGGPLIRARNLSIVDSSGGIDADSRGFLGGNMQGYGNDDSDGLGYGKGLQISYGGGAGHGGSGGDSSGVGSGGPVYGYTNAPGAGSGGAEGASGGMGGTGGGQIRVEAVDTIMVNGIVTANGGAAGHYAGGGSGGGIWLIARRFAGTGVVEAHGGDSNNRGGAGAGGRIAFWSGAPYTPTTYAQLAHDHFVGAIKSVEAFDGFTATVTATNGIGGENAGQPGTVVYIMAPPSGSLIIIL